MRYLMLMWADADAASGDESDFGAWAEFDEQVKAAGAFVLNGALTPAAAGARLDMATETEITPAREPGSGQTPVLVTRLGGQQRIFPVGTQVRVGRDPAFELVSVNPLVSRQCHGVITSDPDGATYVDQSWRGTFLDRRQLSEPLRITESVVLRLGDPATGEVLGITPRPGGAAQPHQPDLDGGP